MTPFKTLVPPGVLESAPAQLLDSERMLLFALVFGLRPQKCLEIGTLHGGSAVITVAALDAVGQGSLTCMDRCPQIAPEVWGSIKHRTHLITGDSMVDLGKAAAYGPFDFAFVDGDHTADGAATDITNVLGMLNRNAYILCHDAYHEGVERAVRKIILQNRRIVDCGILTSERCIDNHGASWGGMWLLRNS
jgi:predicted O-methyltransferase YrrM